MAIFQIFIDNVYLLTAIHLIMLLFIFYALGNIVKEYFSFKKSNFYVSIPIGMMTYILLTQMFYIPLIFLGLNIDVISVIETIKEIAIIAIIIVSYDKWLPKFSFYGLKTISYASITILLSLLIYFALTTYISFFGEIDQTWINNISYIGKNSYYENTNEEGNVIQSTINLYQSFYYWIYITSSHISNSDLSAANNSFYVDEITYFVKYEVAIIWIITINLVIASTIINYERSFFNWTYSLLISILVTLLLSVAGSTCDEFYSITISLTIAFMLFDYSTHKSSSDTIVNLALISTLLYTTVGNDTLFYILIFGMISVLISVIMDGNIVKNTFYWLIINFLVFMWYTIVFTFSNLEFVKSTIIYMILILIIFSLFIFPIYSLGYNSNRRKDLNSFERKAHDRIAYSSIFIGIGLTVIVLISSLLFNDFINPKYSNYFITLNLFGDKEWPGIIIYILFILAPTITIIIFWHYGYKSTFLGLIAFLNIIMNPIVLSFFVEITKVSISPEIILSPTLILLFVWSVGKIKKSTKIIK